MLNVGCLLAMMLKIRSGGGSLRSSSSSTRALKTWGNDHVADDIRPYNGSTETIQED